MRSAECGMKSEITVFDLHSRHSQQTEALISCMRQKNYGFVHYGFRRKNHLCYDNDGLHEQCEE